MNNGTTNEAEGVSNDSSAVVDETVDQFLIYGDGGHGYTCFYAKRYDGRSDINIVSGAVREPHGDRFLKLFVSSMIYHHTYIINVTKQMDV